jgi:hypothetical protein
MDKAVNHVQNGLGGLWNAEQKLMVLQEWQVPGWIEHYNWEALHSALGLSIRPILLFHRSTPP